MTELAFDGSNPDVGLLYKINALAGDLPHWLARGVSFLGEFGVLIAVAALLVWCWWQSARRSSEDAPTAVAGVLWAGLAALVAFALSAPIRGVVQRPRPYDEQSGLHVLLRGTSKFSFVDAHSTLAMAVGIGLFMVHRKAGLVGVGLALLEGFTRVLMGVAYPTDVIGGFALGTATVLLFAPLAMLALVPAVRLLERGRAAVLVRAPLSLAPAAAGDPEAPGDRRPPESACESDLAA